MEQRCPREVPEHILPFGPIQYSGAFGYCTVNTMAGQYSWNANVHSFHLQKWYGFLFLFHRFKAFCLRRFDDVETGYLEIEIAEQTDGAIYLLDDDMKISCRIDSLSMVGIIVPNVLSFLRGNANEGDNGDNDDGGDGGDDDDNNGDDDGDDYDSDE